jgi:phosphatidylserine decarboxylase
VHAPLAGVLTDIAYIPGKLFSVNLTTADHIDGLFAKNERMIFYMNTPQGKCALVMVGALLVAGIKSVLVPHWMRQDLNRFQIHHLDSPVALHAGDELGYFDFGSTVVMVFEKDLPMSLATGTAVRLGEEL